MVTIINAGSLAGYSSLDHLIDDSRVKDVIGKQFRSVGEALRATDKANFINKPQSKFLVPHPYTWVEVRMTSGEVRTHQSV